MDTYIVVVDSFGAAGTRYKIVNTTHATPGVVAETKDLAIAQSIAAALNGGS